MKADRDIYYKELSRLDGRNISDIRKAVKEMFIDRILNLLDVINGRQVLRIQLSQFFST